MKYSIITKISTTVKDLRKTIESVANQILQIFKNIVIDDGATDAMNIKFTQSA